MDAPLAARFRRIAVLSRGIARIPHIEALLGAEVCWHSGLRALRGVDAVAGWGRRPTAQRARELAARQGLPFLSLEDGFLRSVGLGSEEPPLSLVVDDEGIYYDSGSPSRLDRLCASPLAEAGALRAQALVTAWRAAGVSKYNHLPVEADPAQDDYVLVVDQTAGDASLQWGGVRPDTFGRMVEAALAEYPDARVLIRTHPDVLAGRRRGCIDPGVAQSPRVAFLRSDVHPASQLAGARAVYVASSQLGFEALLFGRPLRCFGMPFYAGRGLSADDLPAPAWRGAASLERLVHAALVEYPRYIDPDTHLPATPERVLEHLALQRRMRDRFPGALCAVGFSAWKRPLVRRFLRGSTLRFAGSGGAVRAEETAVVWGRSQAPGAARACVRLEDGFLRSVGLGADLVSPLSWVVDPVGMYYDPTRPSALEQMLQAAVFTPALQARAARLRERIVAAELSKYNLPGVRWQRPAGVSEAVLVVGQVPADAAVRLGAVGIRSDDELLRAARARHPAAHIVYKPHPDVVAGLRPGGSSRLGPGELCDELVCNASLPSLLEGVDAVHVLSSLAGFEALLRGRQVVCHGMPFYAGWGLTQDVAPHPRRTRRLGLDELVAASLILYPTYVNRAGTHYIEAERALEELLDWRARGDPPLASILRTVLRPLLGLQAAFRDRSLPK